MKRFAPKLIAVSASLALMLGIFLLGVRVGNAKQPSVGRIAGIENKQVPADIGTADFEPFWKVWSLIDAKYPGADKITAQERVYGAIQGLVASIGDPYSVYFPPRDSKEFKDTVHGSFEGIGMEVGIKDKMLTVIAPLKDTPAEAAGIQPGDKILKIDGTVTTDMTIEDAVGLIRGPRGTAVKLTLYTEGAARPRELSVTRAVIDIPTLETELRSDGVFVVSLYNFSASSARLMERALRQFQASGSRMLVIDLRGNPGGYLESAVDMASFFLPEGELIVTEDFGANGEPETYRSRGFDLLDKTGLKVAVLVDKGSASASEILAGALQQHGAAKVIGETTYGKGSVQELVDMTDETTLKITVAKWLTPNGTWISEHGIEPDVPVIVTEADLSAHRDPAMLRALQYLKTGS